MNTCRSRTWQNQPKSPARSTSTSRRTWDPVEPNICPPSMNGSRERCEDEDASSTPFALPGWARKPQNTPRGFEATSWNRPVSSSSEPTWNTPCRGQKTSSASASGSVTTSGGTPDARTVLVVLLKTPAARTATPRPRFGSATIPAAPRLAARTTIVSAVGAATSSPNARRAMRRRASCRAIRATCSSANAAGGACPRCKDSRRVAARGRDVHYYDTADPYCSRLAERHAARMRMLVTVLLLTVATAATAEDVVAVLAALPNKSR